MDEKNFLFSLYPKDLIYIKPKNKMILHSTNNEKQTIELEEILGYYVRPDVASSGILFMNYDNTYISEGIGVRTLVELKKYEVDILGQYHEVKIPEKLQYFNKQQKN